VIFHRRVDLLEGLQDLSHTHDGPSERRRAKLDLHSFKVENLKLAGCIHPYAKIEDHVLEKTAKKVLA
jgi:hypothetical protein